MISSKGLDYIKEMASIQANLISDGIMYGVIEGDTVTWVKSSDSFKLDVLYVGKKLDSNSTTLIAIREKKILTQKVPRSVYGTRLTITSIPIVNEDGEAIGAFSMALPRMHPIAKGFKDFAPILAEMYAEGAFLTLTDLNKIAYTQASKKFDIPSLKPGVEITEGTSSSRVLKTRKPEIIENSSTYGVPVLIATYPVFDDEDSSEIIGTLGIITPKKAASDLRNMSQNLENSLTEISSTLEELAASATQIHSNEQDLNNEIIQVIGLSEEINEISSFIKEIADETKMLGLNASIEAARAGEAGRGFGVVAEEIRKLSEQSKGTVPKIKAITDNIKAKVDESSKKANNSLSASQEQAAATEEITASLEEITSMAEELNKIAQML